MHLICRRTMRTLADFVREQAARSLCTRAARTRRVRWRVILRLWRARSRAGGAEFNAACPRFYVRIPEYIF